MNPLPKSLLTLCGNLLALLNNIQIKPLGIFYESFVGGDWNAENSSFSEHKPGLDKSLPNNFKFHQMQGPHSFKAESDIVRFGDF